LLYRRYPPLKVFDLFVLDEILDYVVAGQALQPTEALEVPYF
jgi:hypothetical protein